MKTWRFGEGGIELLRPVGTRIMPDSIRGRVELFWQGQLNGLVGAHVLGLAQCAAPTYRRKLASSSKGFFALLPEEATVGDQIVLMEGGKLPLIVRRKQPNDPFELIGEAYVHGIMFGEAWSPEACETIHIQ
jgi:hypothetical protein